MATKKKKLSAAAQRKKRSQAAKKAWATLTPRQRKARVKKNPRTAVKHKSAPRRFCVQVYVKQGWHTQGEFRNAAAAKDYALALHKRHPRLKVRVFG